MSLWSWLLERFGRGPDFSIRILFVCRANITRSPYLEHRFRKRLQERFPEVAHDIGVASAGVEGFRRAAADPIIRYIASQRDVDLPPHASQAVSHRLIEQADWVFTLEERFSRQILNRFRDSEGNVFPLPMFGNSDLQRVDWDISDPTGKEGEDYEAFADWADEEVERLLDLFSAEMQGTRTNLVFIGLPGSGKSTLGRHLAEALEWEFLDTDDVIEQEAGESLQSIVDTKGYLSLREQEAKVLSALECTNTVIATGGSAVYSDSAMTHLRQLGPLVWLDVELEELLKRIGDPGERGLAKPPTQTLEELFHERNDLYPRWAEHRVEAGLSVEDVLTQLVARTETLSLNIEKTDADVDD